MEPFKGSQQRLSLPSRLIELAIAQQTVVGRLIPFYFGDADFDIVSSSFFFFPLLLLLSMRGEKGKSFFSSSFGFS
jgi:hypothetical protein